MSRPTVSSRNAFLFARRVGEPWGVRIRQGRRLRDPEKTTIVRALLSSKLGVTEIASNPSQDQRNVLRATVLIFTGHHWVRHDEDPGSFHPMNRRGRPIKSKGINLTKVMRTRIAGIPLDMCNWQARLILVSGCYTLQPESARFFKRKFPRAYLLGFRKSSTLYKGDFWINFLQRIQSSANLADPRNLATVIEVWKKFIEDVIKEMRPTNLWKLGSGNPAAREPGYMAPDGRIEVWKRNNQTGEGRWVSK